MRRALCLVVLLLALPAPASADELASATPDEASTAQLIDAAVARDEISADKGRLYKARALFAPEDVPERFQGEGAWDGTLALLELERSAKRMRTASARSETLRLLAAGDGSGDCGGSTADGFGTSATQHFGLEITPAGIGGGLGAGDYAQAIEGAWGKQVDEFGWAAPPFVANRRPPGGRYQVRIDDLGTGLLGYVTNGGSYAGLAGDNPATPWTETDAMATCMVLNRDFSLNGAVRDPMRVLRATTAHEFNHALQFGYGVLSGADLPQANLIEGSATWMEDESADDADDAQGFLFPDFSDAMVPHSTGGVEEYRYWFVLRAMLERFGTGVAGGGEDIMQRTWELSSRGEAVNLDALDAALATRGASLAGTFHDAAVTRWFLAACGTGVVAPLCLEEASSYRYFSAGGPSVAASLPAPGATASGTVEDNYAAQFVRLPAGGPYSITVHNSGTAGALMVSVACDASGAVRRSALGSALRAGESGVFDRFEAGADCTRPVAVISSASRTGATPASDSVVPFTLATAALAPSAGTPLSEGGDPEDAAGSDKTAPRVRVKLVGWSRGGSVRLRVSCPASEPNGCHGSVKAIATAGGRRVSLGTRSFAHIKAGKSRTISYRLSRSARRRLARRAVRLTLRIASTDAARNRTAFTSVLSRRA